MNTLKASTASFGFDADVPPVVELVARVARRLWPNKTARQLAARTRKTHRAAEDWLSLRTGMNADALADLLRSDAGLDVLHAIMGSCSAPPTWWPQLRDDLRASSIERRLDELRDEIEAAKKGLA